MQENALKCRERKRNSEKCREMHRNADMQRYPHVYIGRIAPNLNNLKKVALPDQARVNTRAPDGINKSDIFSCLKMGQEYTKFIFKELSPQKSFCSYTREICKYLI